METKVLWIQDYLFSEIVHLIESEFPNAVIVQYPDELQNEDEPTAYFIGVKEL